MFSWTAPVGVAAYRIDRWDPTVNEWRSNFFVPGSRTSLTGRVPEGTDREYRISARGNGTSYSREYGTASGGADGTTPYCDREASFASASYTATEGGSAVTVTVNFSPSLRLARSIPITVSGSGSYTLGGLTNGNLVAAQGNQSKTFTITANQDSNCADETITLGFTLPSGMTAGTPSSTTVTLSDDDPL